MSKNTLAAYRRDLTLFDTWLTGQQRALISTAELDINAYLAIQHANAKSTTVNRRLTGFKRFFRCALCEHLLSACILYTTRWV